MNLTIMTDEKRKLIDWLIESIGDLKERRQWHINELIVIEKQINEKQSIINELMGLPLKKGE